MPVLTLIECPLCGGKTGYRNRELYEYERHTDWDKPERSQAEYVGVYKRYKRRYCMDCNKCVSSFIDQPEFKL